MSTSTRTRSELRATARAAVAQMDDGLKANRSLIRIGRYTSAEVVKLSESGDSLRKAMLTKSAEAWVHKK